MSVSLSQLPEVWTRAGRDAARAVVRAAPNYSGWLAANPTVDRNSIKKDEITKAAIDLGVVDEVAAAVWNEAVASGHVVDESEAGAANIAEDARVEAKLAATFGNAGVDEAAVEAALAGVLNPVRQYLAPGLVDGIAKSIRPYVVDALKPATIVEKIVEIPAAPVAPAGAAPFAKVVRSETMGKVFSLTGAQRKLPVTIWDAHDAPTPDAGYQVDIATMAQAVTAMEAGEVVMLAGPSGSGKGSLCKEFAARTGRSFLRIGFEATSEVVDLRGQPEPVPGETHGAKMEWVDKAFTAAIRRPGTVILLDELSLAPRTAAWFQTILDDKALTLPTGEVVRFAPGVVVVIADNTAGYGDPSGAYVGTMPMNAALIDRCGRIVVVDYLPPAKEALALHKRTGLAFAACERLAHFAAFVRKEGAKAGGEARAFTYRRLVAFAVATFRDRLTVAEAVDVCWLTRLPEADRETLRGMVRAEFKDADYVREMNGETVEAVSTTPISQAAEQVGARDHFARS